jgi:hypothetical protein
MFPKLCDSDGLHFTELIDYLFEEGIARFEAKEILKTSRQ